MMTSGALGTLYRRLGRIFNKATAFMACFALLSIIAMALGHETRGSPLPR